ncbi:uncharacterized protein [Heterodontus francisci]
MKYIDLKDGKCETAFDFIAKREEKGNYTCQCLTEPGRWIHSKPSDPVQISIRDELPVPRISMDPSSGVFSVGKRVLITCKGDIRCTGGTFHLYRNNKRLLSRDVSDAARNVTFPIDIQGTQTAGNYSCRYQTEVLLNMKHSPFSEDAMISVRVMRGNGLLLYVGLGCAAGILLLIFVAILCFLLVKRGKTRRQNIKSSPTSASLSASKEASDNNYVNTSLSSYPETNRLLPEAPENVKEEITYASLNLEAINRKAATSGNAPDTRFGAKNLQPNSKNEAITSPSVRSEAQNRKNAAPATAPEASVYAEVKKI